MGNFFFSKNDAVRLILQETLFKIGEVVARGCTRGWYIFSQTFIYETALRLLMF